ncbi:MAG: hypothetical protein KUL78_11190 [Flavobacterium sp.]|nr:hypothetical protein [Flavobacterium sp.]
MKEEIKYLQERIAKYESNLIDVNRMAAQSADYAYTQNQLAKELKLLKSILKFIEER